MRKKAGVTASFKVFFHLLGRRGGKRGTERGGREKDRQKLCESRIVPRNRIMNKKEGREGNAFCARWFQCGGIWKKTGEN